MSPALPRRALAALAPAAFASVLAAQPPALPLPEAVSLALAWHPAVAAADAALAGARRGVDERLAARWPALRLDAAATRFEEPMVVAPLHGIDPLAPPLFDETLLQVSASATYTLYDGGTRAALIRQQQAILGGRSADASSARQAVAMAVAQAWLGVASGRQLLAAEDQRLEALRLEAERVRQFLEVGRAAPVEEFRVAAALAQAEASRVARAGELERQELALARLIGLAPDAVRAAAFPPVRPAAGWPDAEAVLAEASAQSPDLARATARLRALEAAEGVATATRWPELKLVAGYTDYSSSAGRLSGEWQAGIRAGYALFTGGARSAAADRAAHERAAADSERRAVQLWLAESVDRVLAAGRAAASRTSALDAAVRQHEEVARIERLALEAGAATQSDWLAAEAALLSARAALIEARHTEILSRLELARLTGTLTPDTLQSLVEAAS